jgi:small conductance mechanosensitive channel
MDIASRASEVINEAGDFVEQIKGYLPKLLDFGINVIIAVVIFIIGRYVIKIILKLCNKFFERAKVEITVRKFLDSLIKVVLYILLIILLCAQVGIQTTSFIAVLGSAGLAIGLALQGSLANFAGGVLILVLKPFKVGDYIVNSTSGQEGTVKRIDLFYTSIVSPTNTLIFIPNGALANSSIDNTSVFDKRRVDTRISINSTEDITKTREILKNLLDQYEKILKDEEIDIFISSITQNQVTIEFRAWVNASDFWEVKCYLIEKAKLALEINNIKLAQNQVEVKVKNE